VGGEKRELGKRVSTHLVTGFLGSGKTTFLRRALTGELADERAAVLVNEFGSVGVDGARLSGGGLDVVELPSGCVCCTLRGDFVRGVGRIIRELGPDRLFVEASGLAEPAGCIAALRSPEVASAIAVEPVICVLDVVRFPQWQRVMPHVAEAQVRAASVVLMNKTDQADAAGLDAIEAVVVDLNPDAVRIGTVHCDVDLGVLLKAEIPKTAYGVASENDHVHALTEAGMGEVAYEGEATFDVAQLKRFLEAMPHSIFRGKGIVRVPEGGLNVDLLPDERTLETVDAPDRSRLVLIGHDLDREALLSDLLGCVVS
jgi:G3E family GTPase